MIWLAVATLEQGHEVAASLHPVRAVLRLCERLVDGARCTHCGKPTGLEPEGLRVVALSGAVCWWRWNAERSTFRRGCEETTTNEEDTDG